MLPKQAACEPCRLSKLACDHVRPVCGRCLRRGQDVTCSYRAKPFKRTLRLRGDKKEAPVRLHELNAIGTRPAVSAARGSHVGTSLEARFMPRHHPNPGYLGPSSHTTIFEELETYPDYRDTEHCSATATGAPVEQAPLIHEEQVKRGQTLLEEMSGALSINLCVQLVEAWMMSGFNLALVGPFTTKCTQSANEIFQKIAASSTNTLECSTGLFLHSASRLKTCRTSKIEDFSSELSCRPRWETLGIFCAAVSRATIDLHERRDLYETQAQRLALRKLTRHYADACLDLCLELDYLNDIQLFLQYENFINHSCVDGDQSYQSWKRLGDVISSLYALGYHTGVRSHEQCPKFLQHLREAAFAFTYSADKNISIFLGRPPRMVREYCNIDFLRLTDVDSNIAPGACLQFIGWNPEEPYNYMIEAWWSMVCALHKEQILLLSREVGLDVKMQRASAIQAEAEVHWLRLPNKFRLTTKLMSSSELGIERDFVASARLNYLHISFLARLAVSQSIGHLTDQLLVTSADILDIVVQVTTTKGLLLNSGTGITWKVAHYGLPAAAVLCLSLLEKSSASTDLGLSKVKIFQHLSVLVSEIDTGALVGPTDPNFALLAKASQAIDGVLQSTLFCCAHCGSSRELVQAISAAHLPNTDQTDNWEPWTGDGGWDFEIDFWTNLAEHPNLSMNSEGSHFASA